MDLIWIFLIITAVVYLLLRYFPRKQKKNLVEQVGMYSLGFQPVPYPEAILKKKVVQLHTKYEGQQLALHDIFMKEPVDTYPADNDRQWIYLFDIQDQAGKEPTILAQDVVAIISSRFNLPRISILTRPNVTGGFGGIMDRFVSRLAQWENNTQSLRRISFPDQPEIDQRYFFFSPNEDHARSFLTTSRLKFMMDLSEHYAIDMSDDIITLYKVITDSNLSRRERIIQTLADAASLSRFLSEPPASNHS